MCLIAVHWRPGSAEPLLLLGNRDESYERPAAPLAWWEGGRLLAGRDLRAGGTWLGLDTRGRLAAVTNFRRPGPPPTGAPSRGSLPVRFLQGDDSPAAFLEVLRGEAGRYAPFNLLLWDGASLLGYQSRDDRVVPLAPGLHLLSNGDFNAPWPKAEALRERLAAAPGDDAALLGLLEDDRPFADAELPRTGVPLDWERALSPIFIRTPAYGTRASTLVRVGREAIAVEERRFGPDGPDGRVQVSFRRA